MAEPAWHPIMAAEGQQVGVWKMIAQYGRCYGIIRIVRRQVVVLDLRVGVEP